MYKNSDLLYSKIKEDTTFWKQVIESLEDYALFVISKEGQVSSWNAGGESLFYYKNEEVIGQQGDILFTSEDRDAGVPKLEMETALKKGKAIDERYHVRRDGSRFWASGLVFPLFDKDGQHIGFTKIMRNLHERKESENRLLAAKRYAEGVIETATSPMVVLNDDLTINTANNAFHSYYHISRDISRHLFFEINDGQWDNQTLREVLEEIRIGKDTAQRQEFNYSFVHMGRRILDFNIRKLHPENIKEGLILIAIEDVTAKKEIDKEKDDFIGIASHELRTPVSSIKAFLQILQRKATDIKDVAFQEYLKRTLELSEKLTVLITTLLDVSRLRTGKLVLKYICFNLKDLISETALHLQPICLSHQILIEGDSNIEV